ncbi:MAG: hypothetical protein KDE27_32335, partial [Planctomycetes bacterium]|nr:hypothetical protein [Planctomycetota bacterium]
SLAVPHFLHPTHDMNRFLILTIALAAAPAAAQTCVHINNAPPGTALNIDVSVIALRLPFAFPFAGNLEDIVTVSPYGWVKFGAHIYPESNGSEALLLAGEPRIVLAWDDWNSSPYALNGGGVFYSETPTSAHILWKDVPRFAFGQPSVFANMELVLSASGRIDLHYLPSHGVSNVSSIVGISAGNNAAANALDLSSVAAANGTVSNATGYELFPANSFDLAGSTISFVPTSATTYSVSVSSPGTCPAISTPEVTNLFAHEVALGGGCPAALSGSWFELFREYAFDLGHTSWRFVPAGNDRFVVGPGAGFDTSYSSADIVAMGDDTIATGSLAAIGGFSYLGTSLPTVDVCSNGFIWMGSNPSTDSSCTAAEFATLGPRIAPCWSDWNINQGGTYYWTATPAFCMATWENVHAWNGSVNNTFQCKFYPSGEIEFSYLEVINNAFYNVGLALVGLSAGGNSGAPVPADIAAANGLVDLTPFTGTVNPVAHSATTPTMGGNYTVTTANLPAGALLGFHAFGFQATRQELTNLGAPGCVQYVDPVGTVLHSIATSASFADTIALPSGNWLAGVKLLSQGAVHVPGINALGLVTSNAVVATIGF